MYGGYGSYDALDDTWSYNVFTFQWTCISTYTNPGKRYRHAMAPLNNTHVVLFGGLSTDDVPLGDTWLYANKEWRWVEPLNGPGPSARSALSLTNIADGRVLLFGGLSRSYADDTWILFYSSKGLHWVEIDTMDQSPPSRSSHAAGSIGDGTVVIFGGATVGNFHDSGNVYGLDDTWVLTATCPPGYTDSTHLSFTSCEPCAVGHYYDETTYKCVICPGDSWTPNSAAVGNSSCNFCNPDTCHAGHCTSLQIAHGILPKAVCNCPALYQFSSNCSEPIGLYILLSISMSVLMLLGIMASLYWKRHMRGRVEQVKLAHRIAIQRKEEDLKLMKQGWFISASELQLTELVAEGGAGQVFRGKWKPLNEEVAIKVMTPSPEHADMDPYEILSIDEVMCMQRVRHPRIVLFFGVGTMSDEDFGITRILVVTQFMTLGSLENVIDVAKRSPVPMTWHQRLQYVRDIAEGMAFLHRQRYLHRDLKSSNILCEEGGRCKIADFGLARLLNNAPRERMPFELQPQMLTEQPVSLEKILSDSVGSHRRSMHRRSYKLTSILLDLFRPIDFSPLSLSLSLFFSEKWY
jgi:hypothetical protein